MHDERLDLTKDREGLCLKKNNKGAQLWFNSLLVNLKLPNKERITFYFIELINFFFFNDFLICICLNCEKVKSPPKGFN